MIVVTPSVDPSLARIASGFRVLSVSAQAAPITNPAIAEAALQSACRFIVENDFPWADEHLNAWTEVFKAFGAKPKRTACSADALRKRVLKDGTMPAIDPVVDLYNAVSIQYAIPVGGENISAYSGHPRLTFADGSEPFDTMKAGEPVIEFPDAGEVIWRDDTGVTCRRWNWRQGIRTRLDSEAQNMWFILESLPAMPLQALHDAGDMLINGLEQLMPGVKTDVKLITLG
ncbi:B3/4 domain-containing protein [Rahnella perminowiae]|uniref:B3/B4 domain-containing protein n=1 Tax=Rahnella perminowiae TaxID=2816244 RepID=UPI00215BCEC2|nr:B3/4 domain-containing protein [Rahnella perminowiae]MCR9003290.1 B3/4 domain-containing protein [Rahnella perminowiae]